MKASDLPAVNTGKNNIQVLSWPSQGLRRENAIAPNMVVFFGSDFLNVDRKAKVDIKEYTRRTNQCLDYLRSNYPRDILLYKPHPNETKEQTHLALKGFEVVAENTVSEMYILNNLERIKATYSTVSTSPIFAWRLGIDSRVFLPYVIDVFDKTTQDLVQTLFEDLPEHFFVRDLRGSPAPMIPSVVARDVWRDLIEQMISKYTGDIWIVVCETKFIPPILALTSIIRDLFPSKKITLVIVQHGRRWSGIVQELRTAYDDIYEFPRLFYSLRPQKLWAAFRIARKIKSKKIDRQDVIFGFAPHSFVENCFISYHGESLKVAFMEESVFKVHFKSDERESINRNELKFNKANWIFNKILEPVLGLHQSLFLTYSSGIDHFVARPQEPINDIYDQVYLFTNR